VNVVVASCVPVWTDIVLRPVDASGSILILAVALVGLLTVTNPQPPSDPLPTAIPGPKLADVTPCEKLVYVPVIVTCTVCPAVPDDWLKDTIEGGLMVRCSELELEN
jgi:hypothetical protein